MEELQIVTNESPNGIVTISLKGSLDAYSHGQLEEVMTRLLEEQVYKFVVDLSGVNYMSSAVSGIFIGLLKVVQEHHGNIVLVNPQPMVKNLFDLLGMHHLFPITADLKHALSMFDEGKIY